MATDNSPPRLKLIVTIAVITVITLLSLNFVLTSYYGVMSDEATRSKLAPTTDKDEQKKHEAQALSNIDKAMKDVGSGNRATAVAQSDDLGAMTGWSKLPKAAPAPGAAAHPTTGDTVLSTGDAGAPMATDAGTPAMDGGAKLPVPAPKQEAPKH